MPRESWFHGSLSSGEMKREAEISSVNTFQCFFRFRSMRTQHGSGAHGLGFFRSVQGWRLQNSKPYDPGLGFRV